MATVASEKERHRARLAELDAALSDINAKRTELLIERGRVSYALEVLDAVDAPRRAARSGPSTGDLAVKIINESERQVWRVPQMVRALEANGWGDGIKGDKANVVRTALNRAADREQIVRDESTGGFVALAFKDEPAIDMSDTAPIIADDPWASPAPVGGGLPEEPPF